MAFLVLVGLMCCYVTSSFFFGLMFGGKITLGLADFLIITCVIAWVVVKNPC